jgi:hypothetical protein
MDYVFAVKVAGKSFSLPVVCRIAGGQNIRAEFAVNLSSPNSGFKHPRSSLLIVGRGL